MNNIEFGYPLLTIVLCFICYIVCHGTIISLKDKKVKVYFSHSRFKTIINILFSISCFVLFSIYLNNKESLSISFFIFSLTQLFIKKDIQIIGTYDLENFK